MLTELLLWLLLTEIGASTFDMLLLLKLLLRLGGTDDTELRFVEGEIDDGGFPAIAC